MPAMCPYCQIVIDPPPTRKKACKGCGNTYLVRGGTPFTEQQAADLDDTNLVGIVGESNYQLAIRGCRPGDLVTLVREPKNKYDRKAIAAHIHGHCIGYISRDENEELARVMDSGRQVHAIIAQMMGGAPGKPLIGVLLGVRIDAPPSPKIVTEKVPPYAVGTKVLEPKRKGWWPF